jgi:hypothetical protein
MRSLSIQVQPNRSTGIDIDGISAVFMRIATLTELVKHHAFDQGNDDGPYFNFTFSTNRPGELWRKINAELYQDQKLGKHMRAASMAACSMEDGWHDYLLLFHFDPTVEVNDAGDL